MQNEDIRDFTHEVVFGWSIKGYGVGGASGTCGVNVNGGASGTCEENVNGGASGTCGKKEMVGQVAPMRRM